jgi:hypothetical protein
MMPWNNATSKKGKGTKKKKKKLEQTVKENQCILRRPAGPHDFLKIALPKDRSFQVAWPIAMGQKTSVHNVKIGTYQQQNHSEILKTRRQRESA